MRESIAPEGLRQTILMWAAIAGLFFGLMPPYVFTIVVVATWGVPALEPPSEQAFRTIYFLRLVLGNVVGLVLGSAVGAITAGPVCCCYSSAPLIRIGPG